MILRSLGIGATIACCVMGAASAQEKIHTIDRLVAHVSTVPAIAGKPIDLFVREKLPDSIFKRADGKAPAGKVVLMVHGGYSPATLAFDVPFKNYSWMDYLAQRGYDVFAMDMTGYGRSGRPMMDDPCNLDPKQQDLLVPKNLPAKCENKYKFELVNSDSESDSNSVSLYVVAEANLVSVEEQYVFYPRGVRAGRFVALRSIHGGIVLHVATLWHANANTSP